MMSGVELRSAPEWTEVFTAAERPDLWMAVRAEDRFRSVWPEYNHHGNHSARYFGALYPKHARLQVLVVNRDTGQVVARGRTIPFRWDGSFEDLPRGIDAVGLRAVEEDSKPTALSALAAEVLYEYQGRGLSGVVIEAMAAAARTDGLAPLVAPVRPSWKDRYPITPIERYVAWCRSDGLPFDPWMRVHARLGASIVRAEPKSLEITRPVADWQRWLGMELPDEGDFVFPGGLAPLSVKDGIGHYWEPNVWMRHELDGSDRNA
jgi:GNAT superfamily N-acetyltransferase